MSVNTYVDKNRNDYITEPWMQTSQRFHSLQPKPSVKEISVIAQYNSYVDLILGQNNKDVWWPLEEGRISTTMENPNMFTPDSISINDGWARNDNNYSYYRFIFRAAPADGEGGIMTLQPVISRDTQTLDNGYPFRITTIAHWYGYSTYVSPWRKYTGNSIGLRFVSSTNSAILRIGTVMIQYALRNDE